VGVRTQMRCESHVAVDMVVLDLEDKTLPVISVLVGCKAGLCIPGMAYRWVD
jgi:hypothetical protein